ncbi:MAG: hypothetical protein LUG13_03095 [Oscillospiraceae bacterium]|nr:hypothetical protein [Oscillospiraceae bacterium]
MLFMLATPIHATESTEYSLDELGLAVSIPSNYHVLTRDMDSSDPTLQRFGITKEDMSSYMYEQNVYLEAADDSGGSAIIITMMDSPLDDFNMFSDTTLSTLATSLASQYSSSGATFINSEIYQHAQAKFLKIAFSIPDEAATVYGLQYYTVYDSKAINITMRSYAGEISTSSKAELTSIVDSVSFTAATKTQEAEYTPTDAFAYTDPETQTTFTVPANWVEEPLSEERDYIDVKFSSLEEEGMLIIYGSYDVWNELSASERLGYSRSDINNSSFTKADIAESYGLASDDISIRTYGGNEYFMATTTSDTEMYDASFSITFTRMIMVDNGYMYLFQVSGTPDSAIYEDFEALLSSAEFSTPVGTANAVSLDTDLTSPFRLGDILLSFLLTIAVYALPIIIYRYAIRKAPVSTKKAKWITIIYGICAFIVMSFLLIMINGSGAAGGAILVWGYINYRILIDGQVSVFEGRETPPEQNQFVVPEETESFHPASNANGTMQSDARGPEETSVSDE